MAADVEHTLNEYLTAGLMWDCSSFFSSTLVVIPKKSGGVPITANYNKLNQIRCFRRMPISHGDQVLDYLGQGRVFAMVDLISSFHQIVAYNTV